MTNARVLGEGQGPLSGFMLCEGTAIALNDRAREWTRDLVFHIIEVKAFGVKCYSTTWPEGVHASDGKALYLAPWDEISGIV